PDVYAPLTLEALTRLIDVTLYQKRYPQAAAWSAKLPTIDPQKWQGHHQAAPSFARCPALTAGDPTLPWLQRQLFAAADTRSALEQLRLALSKGFTDRKSLPSDPAFAALRSNAEFQKLAQPVEPR